MEGVMPSNLSTNAAPRVNLDQRAREARIRLERVKQHLFAHLAAKAFSVATDGAPPLVRPHRRSLPRADRGAPPQPSTRL
jgi:hypothetical protein